MFVNVILVFLDPESEKIQRDISAIFLDSEENFISFPSSMHQLDEDEYSDGSSEPDFVADGNPYALSATSPLASANPYLSMQPDNQLIVSTLRKRSQQYMADDEADYCSEDDRRRGGMRRKPIASSLRSPITPEESDHPVSPYYDTDYSRETYSSPFSYVTSTAEDREEEEDEDHQRDKFSAVNTGVIRKKASIPTTIHWEAGKGARSRPSNISLVSLQIPPVPMISAVIVPSERQSDMLLQNLEMNSSAQQPSPQPQPPPAQHQQESMIYKPPQTTSTIVGESPNNVDILMKNASAALHQGTPPCQETNSREYFAEGENDDEDQSNNVNRNFSPGSGNESFKYRGHHH